MPVKTAPFVVARGYPMMSDPAIQQIADEKENKYENTHDDFIAVFTHPFVEFIHGAR